MRVHGRARRGGRLQRPAGPRRRARRRPGRGSSPTCSRRSKWPSAASSPTTSTRASHPTDMVEGGITVSHLTRPVGRAGIYAPGGRARYPSTVLMCAAPARVAGVASIALCVPPASDGRVDDATLCAASVAGVDEVYRSAGHRRSPPWPTAPRASPPSTSSPDPATPTSPRRSARCQASSGVASAFAGPSEIVVVAAPGATPAFAAIDLVVQAEHGPDGLAWLVTWDGDLLAAVSAEVDRIVAASSRRADLESTLATAGIACLVDGPEEAVAVTNAVAPEHLQLMVPAATCASCCTTCRTPERSSWASGRPPAWVTTWRVPITSCPPTGRRASRPRCGPTTSASTYTPSTSRRTRSAPSVRTW